jgi:hypothetical protein
VGGRAGLACWADMLMGLGCGNCGCCLEGKGLPGPSGQTLSSGLCVGTGSAFFLNPPSFCCPQFWDWDWGKWHHWGLLQHLSTLPNLTLSFFTGYKTTASPLTRAQLGAAEGVSQDLPYSSYFGFFCLFVFPLETWSCHVAQASLEPAILQPLPSEC